MTASSTTTPYSTMRQNDSDSTGYTCDYDWLDYKNKRVKKLVTGFTNI